MLLAIIYLSFISLGLPDSMLGAAWPNMYVKFGVPISYAGIISSIICLGTIISSLQSDRLTLKLGAGKVTAISMAMTAISLIGFSLTHNFWLLCLWAIPYGLGGGNVDAALNNYVALHYESRHMSWLHCMWGVGAATGPYVMGYARHGMERRLPHRWHSADRAVCSHFPEPASLEEPIGECSRGQCPAPQTHGAEGCASHSRCQRSVDLLLLLLRSGTDRRPVGQLLSDPVQKCTCRYGCQLCRHVLHRHHHRARRQRLYDHQAVGCVDDPSGQGLILLGIVIMLIPEGATLSLIGLILTCYRQQGMRWRFFALQ